jgi:hypothetical protein
MYAGNRIELLDVMEKALRIGEIPDARRSSLHLLAGRVAAQLGDYARSEDHLVCAIGDGLVPESPVVVGARITLAENRALGGDLASARSILLGLEDSEVVLQDEVLKGRLILALAIVEQLSGNFGDSMSMLRELRESLLVTEWLDARVKVEVVAADNLRHQGMPGESEAILIALTAEIDRTRSSELRELVLAMLSTLRALSGDRVGVIYFGAESLSAMCGESRDIESVLRVALSLEVVGVDDLGALADAARRLLEVLLSSFPAPQVLLNEFRALRLPAPNHLPKRGIPSDWVALADSLLYELRRAVAMGSAR